MQKVFSLIQEIADKRVWSRGVELARTAHISESKSSNEDRIFEIIPDSRGVIYTVELNEESEVWGCNCELDEDPCPHVVAVAIAAKAGLKDSSTVKRSSASESMQTARVWYLFKRIERGDDLPHLSFHREIRFADGRTVEVQGSLAKELQSLRNESGSKDTVGVSEQELTLDHLLNVKKSGILDPKTTRVLLPALRQVAERVLLDEASIQLGEDLLVPTLSVSDEEKGFRIRGEYSENPVLRYQNGLAVVVRDGKSTLLCTRDTNLSIEELQFFTSTAVFFPRSDRVFLATEVIPRLLGKLHVLNNSSLPKARRIEPRIVLETVTDDKRTSLTIVPHLVYGDPVIAEVRLRGKVSADSILELKMRYEAPIRDRVRESTLIRDLHDRLGLQIGEGRGFEGAQAVAILERVRGWETVGHGKTHFQKLREIKFEASGDSDTPVLQFKIEGPDGDVLSFEKGVAAWRRGESFVQGASGIWGELPKEWLQLHAETLSRFFDGREFDPSESRAPKLSALAIADACRDAGSTAPESVSKFITALNDPSSLTAPDLPTDFAAELRPYQRHGVAWLSFMKANNLGCILADDMGLGKTVQLLAVIPDNPPTQGARRFLVVVPTSVISSWKAQIIRFRSNLSYAIYHGPRRELQDVAITLTTYSILRLDIDILSSQNWEGVFLDESQMIRNPGSQVASAAYRLRSDFKVAVSGTPIENSLTDLWSQMNFAAPGFLGSLTTFEERYSGATVIAGETARLKKKITPFILRRLKGDVAKDLPPKTEVVLNCELLEEERILYDALLGAARQKLVESNGEKSSNAISVLEQLLRLRQACCHPSLVQGMGASESSKLLLLRESILQSNAAGHKSIVFSQWTSFLDIVENDLIADGIKLLRIDGSTRDRENIVEQFQNDPTITCILLSLKAGGVGITLTAADHVYLLDPWWNPAVEDQAIDRAHRIGQENPVLVHRLIATNTVEEKILLLHERKRALLKSTISDSNDDLGSEVGALTREELLELLN